MGCICKGGGCQKVRHNPAAIFKCRSNNGLYFSLSFQHTTFSMAGIKRKAEIEIPIVDENDLLKLTPLGSGNEVGRSSILLEYKGKKVLVCVFSHLVLRSLFSFFCLHCSTTLSSLSLSPQHYHNKNEWLQLIYISFYFSLTCCELLKKSSMLVSILHTMVWPRYLSLMKLIPQVSMSCW